MKHEAKHEIRNSKFERKFQIRNSKEGVSLIIAIVFVSAFLFVIAGLFEAQIKTFDSLKNREQEAKAQYLAESAAELAAYWASVNGAGMGTGDLTGSALTTFQTRFLNPLYTAAGELGVANCSNLDGNASTPVPYCVNFEVKGRAASSDTLTMNVSGADVALYSIPVKGTGDAAGECADASSVDDGCNWNRLYVGQSAEIPLYYEAPDTNGDGQREIIKPANSGTFRLRVRTPCEDFQDGVENCDAGERIVLYPLVDTSDPPVAFRNIEKDTVLVQWLISDAGNVAGQTLIAKDNHNTTTNLRPKPDISDRAGNAITDSNTELSGGRINDANPITDSETPTWNSGITNFVVLERTHNGKDLNGTPRTIGCFINSLSGPCSTTVSSKPVLRLSLVGQPRKDDGGVSREQADLNDRTFDVPYLEYQLLVSSSPVSDSKSSIVGKAEIGGFTKEWKIDKDRPQTLGGFALESF